MIQHPYVLDWEARETMQRRLREAERAHLASLVPRRSWRGSLAGVCRQLAAALDDPEPEPTGPAAIRPRPSEGARLAA